MGKLATIVCFVITFLLLGGIAVLIAWLADKMKSPTFFLDRAVVNGYSFTAGNRLNATFSLTVRSHNRDSKYKIDYDVIVVSVYHSGYTLAYDSLGSLTQPHGADILFKAQPTARNVLIRNSQMAEDIKNEARAGQLGLEVRVRALVKYEVARWKHKSYVLKIICSPVLVSLSSGNSSKSASCDVERF